MALQLLAMLPCMKLAGSPSACKTSRLCKDSRELIYYSEVYFLWIVCHAEMVEMSSN